MDNKERIIIGVLLVIVFISGCSQAVDYNIVGDDVYVDDANIYLNVTPHTITESQWVEAEFESKVFGGDIDFAFGFDTSFIKPKKMQIWHNEQWVNWNPTTKINFDYADMDTWYYATDRSVTAGNRYKIRYYLELIPGGNGKYTLALKPSSENFQQAIENEHLYMLDPWYNTTYTRKVPIEVNTTTNVYNYTLNLTVTYDADMQNDFGDLRFVNKNNDTELGYYIERKSDGSFADVWVMVDNITTDNGIQFYMYYGDASVASNSDEDNAFLIHEDFEDGADDTFPARFGLITAAVGNWDVESTGAIAGSLSLRMKDDAAGTGWGELMHDYQLDNQLINGTHISYKTSPDGAKSSMGVCSMANQGECTDLHTFNTEPSGSEDIRMNIFTGGGVGNQLDTDDQEISDDDVIEVNQWTYGSESNMSFLILSGPNQNGAGETKNNTQVTNIAGNFSVIAYHANGDGRAVFFDDIRVRKYLASEPTYAFGAEESTSVTVTINSITPSPAYYNSSLVCNASLVHGQETNMDGNFTWFRNGVQNTTFDTIFSGESSGANVTSNQVTGTLTVGDNWTCSVFAHSAGDQSVNNTANSSIIISNYGAPSTPTTTPADDTSWFGDINLSCSGSTDDEGDTIYYEFYNGSANNILQNTTSTTFLWGNLSADTHNWSCRAWDGSSGSAYVNRSINKMNFTTCTVGDSSQALNFTVKDETNDTFTNATQGSMSATLTSSVDSEEYTFTLTKNSTYPFCLNPFDVATTIDYSLSYKGDSYPERVYAENTTIGTALIHRVLYLLHSDEGSYSSYHVSDITGIPLDEVDVSVTRVLGGSTIPIAGGDTDSSGSVTFWLDPDISHTFTFARSGYITSTQTITPASPDYYITLATSAQNISYTGDTEGMIWRIGPQSGLLSSGVEYNFSFNITASKENLFGCKIELVDSDGSILDSAEGCTTPNDAGNISLLYTMPGDYLWGRYYLKIDNTSNSYFLIEGDTKWVPLNVTSSGNTLNDFFSSFRTLSEWSADENSIVATVSAFFFFFIAVTLVLGLFSYFSGVDLRNPGFIILLLFGLVFLASSSGWFTIDFSLDDTTTSWASGFWEQWWLTVISGLISVGWLLNYMAARRFG